MITIAQKDRAVRRIDEKNPNLVTGGGQLIQSGSTPVATPSFPTAPAPQNVTVSSGQALLRTTYTPKVLVAVSWDAPVNLQPESYSIESAENVNFTTNLQRWSTVLTSGVIELKTNTDYWVRVQAVVRGVYSEYGYTANYPVASVHTMNDTTAPGPVTSVSTDWSTGDLRWRWTNPSDSNFFQTRLRIYNTFGGTLYREVMIVGNPGSTSHYTFTVDENNQVTANNPLTTVYYELLAYSLAGVPSATTVTGTVTKLKPTIPTGLTSTWTGDDGTYDEGVTFSWTAVTGAATYRVIIDNVTKTTPRILYHYAYSENVSDHRPTLVSGDYALSWTVQAIDALGQVSGGASGTATNLAPSSSNLTLSYVPGFSSLYAAVTPTTEIKDLFGYRWTLKSGGVTVQSTLSFTPEVTFTTLYGNYALEIYAIDLFGRRSNAISGVNIILDGLSIDQLRAETQYTNSIGTNPTTLAGLKDNNLLTSVVTIASGTSWKWTKAERPLLDRYHAVTLAVSGAATNWPVVYFGVSSDDSTYRWFAGPLTGNYGIELTEHASETIAQASGVLLTTNINRFDFPSIAEGRFVKMGHRGNIHNLAEYYPRRIIQSDDVETESLKAINIAAQTITADKIQVFSLNASTATISGILSIGLSGGLYQGTGTFASPITGLKLWNQSGIGRFTTYSGGIAQVDVNTTGQLNFGAGEGYLDNAGIALKPEIGSIATDLNSYRFEENGTVTGRLYGYRASSNTLHAIGLEAPSIASHQSQVRIDATSPLTSGALVHLGAFSSTQDTTLDIYADRRGVEIVTDEGGNKTVLLIDNGAAASDKMLHITASGIAAGSYFILAEKRDPDDTRFYVKGDGTTYVRVTGGSLDLLTIEDTAVNSDNLLKLYDSGNTIGAGSKFITALKGGTEQFMVRGDGVVNTVGVYWVSSSQVVGARKTGWSTATGTATRTTFDTATVTTAQLAQRVKALIDDLHSSAGHGLIGT